MNNNLFSTMPIHQASSHSAYVATSTKSNGVKIDIFKRGAIGAVRTSKLDKTPVKSALHRCRLLFFKIKVRPRLCRSYPIRSPCSYIQILCRFQKCKQKVPSPSLLSSVMKNHPLPQQERFFSSSIRVIFHKIWIQESINLNSVRFGQRYNIG